MRTSAVRAGRWAAWLISSAATAAAAAPADHARSAAALEASFRAGRYEEVIRRGSRDRNVGATVLVARAELALGQYDAARDRLERASTARPDDLQVRHALIDCLSEIGEREAIATLVDRTYEDWRQGRVDRRRANDLMAVAAAVRHDNNWQDANEVLRTATRAEPNNPRPNVMWGAIFLEKHAADEAEASFRDALADDPTNPDAHVGLAHVFLQKRYDVPAAERELAAALEVNRRHAGAWALHGELSLDREDFQTAASVVTQLRRTNPHDRSAAYLQAAAARLLDDEKTYEQARAERQRVHPADGDFYASVADILVRHRRYDDARALADEGVAADPKNASALAILGTTLLRLGIEDRGVEVLRKAWERDPYDMRTYNLLGLYEKVIPTYEIFETKHLRFRVAPRSRRAVELVVAPFLEETYAAFAKRYSVEPRTRVTFELYEDARHYAIRTVGLPGLDVAAVCFGRLITARAPGADTGNWGMVLAHELAHVFAIELSRSRVPRWFTEGLAEVETQRLRPEWRRHSARQLWGATRRGELPRLDDLSAAFVAARTGEERTLAYAHAAAAVDYIERRLGFAAVREALVRFGRRERGLSVVSAAAGVSAADLEAGFRAELAKRTSRFDGQYLPTETLTARSGSSGLERLPPAGNGQIGRSSGGSISQPIDPLESLVRRGLAALRSGDAGRAAAMVAEARRLPRADKSPALAFLTGEVALARRDAAAARAAFLELLEMGGDGYEPRVRLALAEIHRHDLPAAEAHLRRALAFDPESIEAHGLLVELLGDPSWKADRKADRMRETAATLRLEPLHAPLAHEVLAAIADTAPAQELAQLATLTIFIDPASAQAHAALGRAFLALDRPADAVVALERSIAFGLPTATDAPLIRRWLAEAKTRARR